MVVPMCHYLREHCRPSCHCALQHISAHICSSINVLYDLQFKRDKNTHKWNQNTSLDSCTLIRMMGIKRIQKFRVEEIRARAGVANISETIRYSDTEMVRTCGENYRGRCGNENMDDESDRALKNRKSKTEVE